VIGETPSAAEKFIKHFEKHDLEQLEATRKVRHDMSAVYSMSQQGRQDLKTLFELEQAEAKDQI
jgi:glutathione-regulated potassium-efflux system ancillary protein KefC